MAAQLIAGDRSQREVAKALGVGFSTLRRALKLRPGQGAGRSVMRASEKLGACLTGSAGIFGYIEIDA
jgi:Trp operon repressor